MSSVTLVVRCKDRTGLVAALSDFVFRYDGNVLEADQYSDTEIAEGGEHGAFFMRIRWDITNFSLDRSGIEAALSVLSQRFDLDYTLSYDDEQPRVALFCSSTPHCVYDLLLRQEMGEFLGRIVVIISNHEKMREVAEHFSIPFEHVPVTAENKNEAEERQQAILKEHRVNLVVLARYMQVLSPSFVRSWRGQIINIHHSFLPAFAGARPYHQARMRGVKIIGATAHYVTEELDEGPIIEQDVAHVSHHHGVADLVRIGRDLERQVLSRAVRLHLERRLVIDGNRTIVFR